jgi:hypothetical protein
MSASSDFDALYAATWRPLLLQTFALCGDLGTAREAVAHAFVEAWHHWSRASRGSRRRTSGPPRSPGPSGAAGPARSSAPLGCRSRSGWPCAACTRCRSRLARRSSSPASRISDGRDRPADRRDRGARGEAARGRAGPAPHEPEPPRRPGHGPAPELETTARAAAQPVPEDLRASGDRRRRLFLVAGCVAAVALTLVAGALVRVQPTTQVDPAGPPRPGGQAIDAARHARAPAAGEPGAVDGREDLGQHRRQRDQLVLSGVPVRRSAGAAHLRPLIRVRRPSGPQGQPDDRALPQRPAGTHRLRHGGQVVRWLSAGTRAAALVVRRATAG